MNHVEIKSNDRRLIWDNYNRIFYITYQDYNLGTYMPKDNEFVIINVRTSKFAEFSYTKDLQIINPYYKEYAYLYNVNERDLVKDVRIWMVSDDGYIWKLAKDKDFSKIDPRNHCLTYP